VITDRRRLTRLLGISVLLVGSSWMAADTQSEAHAPYALLFGTIFGADQRPLYGVKISIRRADQKKPKWEVMSDHRGEFAQRVPAGKADYVITAEVKTPKNQPKPELTVHVDNDERKDFALHLK